MNENMNIIFPKIAYKLKLIPSGAFFYIDS